MITYLVKTALFSSSRALRPNLFQKLFLSSSAVKWMNVSKKLYTDYVQEFSAEPAKKSQTSIDPIQEEDFQLTQYLLSLPHTEKKKIMEEAVLRSIRTASDVDELFKAIGYLDSLKNFSNFLRRLEDHFQNSAPILNHEQMCKLTNAFEIFEEGFYDHAFNSQILFILRIFLENNVQLQSQSLDRLYESLLERSNKFKLDEIVRLWDIATDTCKNFDSSGKLAWIIKSQAVVAKVSIANTSIHLSQEFMPKLLEYCIENDVELPLMLKRMAKCKWDHTSDALKILSTLFSITEHKDLIKHLNNPCARNLVRKCCYTLKINIESISIDEINNLLPLAVKYRESGPIASEVGEFMDLLAQADMLNDCNIDQCLKFISYFISLNCFAVNLVKKTIETLCASSQDTIQYPYSFLTAVGLLEEKPEKLNDILATLENSMNLEEHQNDVVLWVTKSIEFLHLGYFPEKFIKALYEDGKLESYCLAERENLMPTEIQKILLLECQLKRRDPDTLYKLPSTTINDLLYFASSTTNDVLLNSFSSKNKIASQAIYKQSILIPYFIAVDEDGVTQNLGHSNKPLHQIPYECLMTGGSLRRIVLLCWNDYRRHIYRPNFQNSPYYEACKEYFESEGFEVLISSKKIGRVKKSIQDAKIVIT